MYYKTSKASKSKCKSWTTPYRRKNSVAHNNPKTKLTTGSIRDTHAISKLDRLTIIHARNKAIAHKKELEYLLIGSPADAPQTLINRSNRQV